MIRSGEALGVGWSRNMLYSGFNILPRSVVRSAYSIDRSDNLDVIPLKLAERSGIENTNPYDSPLHQPANERVSPPFFALIGLAIAIVCVIWSLLAQFTGYETLSLWYGYLDDPNRPVNVWGSRFAARRMERLFRIALCPILVAGGACFLTCGTKWIFRLAVTITLTGLAVWILIACRYALVRH